MNTLIKAALLTSALTLAGNALADCTSDSSPAQVRKAYTNAQNFERAGKKREALFNYFRAQDYICEDNPVERDAAQRAAVLARELAPKAEAQGNLQEAFDLYEAGGLYAAADRALIALLRKQPDDISLFERARQTFSYRALEAFAANNALRIEVTGPYRFDAKLLTEVMAMPAQGVARDLAKETSAFNEQYLQDLVAVVQSQPANPLDMAGWQRAQAAQQYFAGKWQRDPVKESLDVLEHARAWTVHVPDAAAEERLHQQRRQRLTERAELLTQRYSGAPQLLESAKDYYGRQNLERPALEVLLARIHTQALTQATIAEQAGSLTLAAAYYDVAEQPAKAQGARDRVAQLAQAQMAPAIDQAKAQAEQMRAAYSDPKKIEAMRNQALEAQRSLKEAQAKQAGSNASRADDLEKELGL